MHLVCSANFGLPCPVVCAKLHFLYSADLGHPCPSVNKFTPAQNSEFAAIARDFAGKFQIDSAVWRCSGKAAPPQFPALSVKTAPGFQGGFTVDIEKKFEMVTGILWGEVVI